MSKNLNKPRYLQCVLLPTIWGIFPIWLMLLITPGGCKKTPPAPPHTHTFFPVHPPEGCVTPPPQYSSPYVIIAFQLNNPPDDLKQYQVANL